MFNKNNKTTPIRITPTVLPKTNNKPIIPFVSKKNTIKPYKLVNHNSLNVNSNNLPPPPNPLESITKNNINKISEINIMMSESNLKKIPKLK